MKNIFLITLITTANLLFALAFEPEIKIHVKGLVCDFCARSVEKTFGKLEAVEAIHVDLENGVIYLGIKANEDLSDPMIQKLIKDNGYSLESIERM